MRTSVKTIVYGLFLMLFVVFACNKDGDDEITKEGPFEISELAGNWAATTAAFNDGTQSVEIVGDGGTVSLTVQSSGRFVMTISPAERASYTVSGEMFWEIWEGNYYFSIEWDNYPDDWDTYGATLTATTFTINGGFDSAEFDFDNDGTFESCSISVVFVRS